MKWSESFIFTLREDPSDAEIISHRLMVRGGYFRKLSSGVFTYGVLTLKVIRKLEAIVREELERAGCSEVLMPMVQPKELWEESGRWSLVDDLLAKFEDRNGREHCLGATHEEVITDYVRKDLRSYKSLPICLFQIQSKFRNEIRPRFGLMRGREFIMKDAYSFDVDKDSALKSYERMRLAYERIFLRTGLKFRGVDADSGGMGGDFSQEFHALADSGEDGLLVSEDGEFAANVEICPAIDANPKPVSEAALEACEEFSTPGLRTIKDLSESTGVPEDELVKTMFFKVQKSGEELDITVLLRGCDEVNPFKIKNSLKLEGEPRLLTDEEVKALTGASPGSCGPMGLSTPIYIDKGVENLRNYIVGANKDDFHIKNVNHPRDFQVTEVLDLRLAKPGDANPKGDGVLKPIRGIEVGHIFYLGTKYSKAMGAKFLDQNGKEQVTEMGCYGIGITRTVQAAVEQNHDDKGIVWPVPITPCHVHICHLDPKDEAVDSVATNIYQSLKTKGWDVLLDDRKERPGVKFKDADLLGFPIRLTIGGKGVAKGEVELKFRKTGEQHSLRIEKVEEFVQNWLVKELVCK